MTQVERALINYITFVSKLTICSQQRSLHQIIGWQHPPFYLLTKPPLMITLCNAYSSIYKLVWPAGLYCRHLYNWEDYWFIVCCFSCMFRKRWKSVMWRVEKSHDLTANWWPSEFTTKSIWREQKKCSFLWRNTCIFRSEKMV